LLTVKLFLVLSEIRRFRASATLLFRENGCSNLGKVLKCKPQWWMVTVFNSEYYFLGSN